MAKSFAPRVSKKERKKIDLSDKLGSKVFKSSDDKLLAGAKLREVELASIRVKEQVRTKFNDRSLNELAENIKVNGLIQPLVVHQDRGGFTLICGERRYRAMTLLKLEKAPCFVLTGKSEKELMAIQFSENSSREELHYIDRADGILNYQLATKASERKITAALSISKSEVHRSLIIAKLPAKVKQAAKDHDIEKYVLVEFNQLPKGRIKTKIAKLIENGEVHKRLHLRRAIKELDPKQTLTKKPVSKTKAAAKKLTPKQTEAVLSLLKSNSQQLDLDDETAKLLKELVNTKKQKISSSTRKRS